METNLLKIEEKILNFWKKDKTFEKSLQKRKKDFIFYEGPPTANAKPGIHHVLSRVFKDVVCRYKTMRGFRVLRKAGWDTHGLPVELEIEKKLGTKTKKDIEKFGIEKFNSLCKKSVFEYKKDWEKLTERIGFWLDLKNAYITFDPEYIETVWFILKKLWEKGLLYEDLRVSPYCPRCQTVLSSHEVAQGYKRIKEPAIYVKFKILNSGFKNTSLLVWTTTPWTLPANVAVAANPNFDYLIIKVAEEFLILAKERMKSLNIEGEIVKEIKGTKLVGLKYQPPFNFYQPDSKKEKAWEVLPADFVSLEEGTGLVHIAPAFGEEDMELIKTQSSKLKAQNLPVFR
jgi:Isoleucyl-tRNA synthetase (EC 6.1.1.5)